MMKSFLTCIVFALLVDQIAAFTVTPVGVYTSRVQSLRPTACFGTIADELEEVWSRAASAGQDAIAHTTEVVKDRAFDYKLQAVNRIHSNVEKVDSVNQDSFEIAAAEYDEVMMEQVEKTFDTDYKHAIHNAEDRFFKAIGKAETIFGNTMDRIETAYDSAVKREKQHYWMSDIKFRAKGHCIHTTAAAEELFQIAVEKAELNFEEEKIKAESARDLRLEYYEKSTERIWKTRLLISPHSLVISLPFSMLRRIS
jgi:hypothetical protein